MPPDALTVTIELEREEAYELEHLLVQRPSACDECPMFDEGDFSDDVMDLSIAWPLDRILLKLREAL